MTNPKDAKDQRKDPRKQVRLEVKIPTATMLKVLWTCNMSKGGMAIETPEEIPLGTQVSVALMLPLQEIELKATVKHITPRRTGKGFFVGVGFENLDAPARAAIEKIIGTVKEFKVKARDIDHTDIDLGEDS